MVGALGGREEARIAGSPIVTSAIGAAWANGMMGHADETDDHHLMTRTHPGCAVIPAALAAGERVDANGSELLRAIVLGYDVTVRVAEALNLVREEQGHHVGSLAGVFGAAAAAAALLRLDAGQMRHVLSFAAQQAAGIASWKRDSDHVEKAFVYGGMPARNGVSAALMVEAGFTGVDDVFAGRHNFLEVYSPQPQAAALARELGTTFEISRTNIKKWCTGGPIQAPLDGLSALLSQGLSAAEIERLEVRIADREAPTVDNSKMPDVCLQHILGVMLVDGALSFAAGHDAARMSDPAVLRERAKVGIVRDRSFDLELPRRPVSIVAVLKSGERRAYEARAVRGTFDNPMEAGEVEAKAASLDRGSRFLARNARGASATSSPGSRRGAAPAN